jgi:hypothetical protein
MTRPKHQTSSEYRRLLKLAREYRQSGYCVTLNPSAAELPPQLANCPFDLIAKGNGKSIAVEVRNKENLTLNGSEDLRRMTDLIDQTPGWELELVITNPRRRSA